MRSEVESRGVGDDGVHAVIQNLCMEMHWSSQGNCLSMAGDGDRGGID